MLEWQTSGPALYPAPLRRTGSLPGAKECLCPCPRGGPTLHIGFLGSTPDNSRCTAREAAWSKLGLRSLGETWVIPIPSLPSSLGPACLLVCLFPAQKLPPFVLPTSRTALVPARFSRRRNSTVALGMAILGQSFRKHRPTGNGTEVASSQHALQDCALHQVTISQAPAPTCKINAYLPSHGHEGKKILQSSSQSCKRLC